MIENKKCKDCHKMKNIKTEFSKVRQNVDGRNHQCKKCQNAKGAQRTKALKETANKYRVQ